MERTDIEARISRIRTSVKNLRRGERGTDGQLRRFEQIEILWGKLQETQRALELYTGLLPGKTRKLIDLEQLSELPPTEKAFSNFVREFVETRESIEWADTFKSSAEIRRRGFERDLVDMLVEFEEYAERFSGRVTPDLAASAIVEAPRLMIVTSSQPKEQRAFEAPRKVVASGKRKKSKRKGGLK